MAESMQTGADTVKPPGALRTAVALSGGGHRATLWALGVLLYIADAGRNDCVASIASVSGGSLANAALGYGVDYGAAGQQDFEQVIAATARRAASGTVFAWWGTWAYLILVLVAVPIVVGAGPWQLSIDLWLQILLCSAGVIVWSLLLTLRGRVTGRAFAKTLFGAVPGLDEMHSGIDHVLCATDLHAGEHVYFSGRFVCAYRFGFGVPGALKLHRPLQASAAFPPVFPVTWIRTKGFGFQLPAQPEATRTRALALADGGVYDNMADQWAQGSHAHSERWATLTPDFNDADELVVANASASLGWKSTWKLRIPILGELLSLLSDKSVLYDNGTSVRREALVDAFDLAEHTGSGLKGCLVHIEQSPFKEPDKFTASTIWPGRATRARAALEALGNDTTVREHWDSVAAANATVPTTLVGLGDEVSTRLMHHAYLLAMVNLHVILDWPLLAVPTRDRFRALLTRNG